MKTTIAEQNNYLCPECQDELTYDRANRGFVRHKTNAECGFGRRDRDEAKKPRTSSRQRGLISLLILLFIGAVLTGCGLSKDDIQNQVKDLLQQDFETDTKFMNVGLQVKSVDLIKDSNNTFKGIAIVTFQGEDHKVSINVTTDGDKLMYETESLDFVP